MAVGACTDSAGNQFIRELVAQGISSRDSHAASAHDVYLSGTYTSGVSRVLPWCQPALPWLSNRCSIVFFSSGCLGATFLRLLWHAVQAHGLQVSGSHDFIG